MTKEKSLSELTDLIVQNRLSNQKLFASRKDKLDKISSFLDSVIQLNRSPLWRAVIADSNKNSEWNHIYKSVESLETELERFTSEDGDFTIANSRAQRSFVNVGAIGIMREGKSEFIAQTTNLHPWILPRKKGEHACTNTSINVINGKTYDGKSNIIRVYFYSVREIASIFADYMEEFGLDRPKEIEGIKNKKELVAWRNKVCLHEPKDGKPGDYSFDKDIPAEKGKLKIKFHEYLDHLDIYISKLYEDADNESFFVDFDIEEVKKGQEEGRKYYSSVSYYDDPNANKGNERFYSFATKKAEIYTNFDVDGESVVNLQFLDTPGIGEVKVGVDQILSEAVTMNLDIIIAIRAINNSAKEDTEQKFVNILQKKLNGKNSAKDWIYYILNVWDDQNYETAMSCRDDLKVLFKTGSESSQIGLEDDHFAVINLKDGYELLPNDDKRSGNPLGKYLHVIFEKLIPQIKTIDVDFFKKSEKVYNSIIDKFNSVYNQLRSVGLNQYSDHGQIQGLINSLRSALQNEGAKEPRILDAIEHKIQEFCSQKDGTLVCKAFDVEVSDNKNAETPETLFDQYGEQIRKKYQKSSWYGGYDFREYNNIKDVLKDIIEEDILKRIDSKQANELLSEIKETIALIFINSGQMSFISHNSENWFEEAQKIFEKEGQYPNLLHILTDFMKYEINTEVMFNKHITSVTSQCMHHDDFGDTMEYNFEDPDQACKTILHSLLNIEHIAKGLISDAVISSDIVPLQRDFLNIYYRLTRLGITNETVKSDNVAEELYAFYENHAAEVFKDDEVLQKRGLVQKWNQLIKSHE